MKKRLVLFLASLLILSGCTSLGRLDSTAAVETDKTVFIIGVQPDNYRISVFPGSVKDGVFKQNIWRPAAVFGAAQDGYVVGKADGGDTLAITWIRVTSSESALLGSDFKACEGVTSMVFTAPAGKVIYLTDINYRIVDDQLHADYSQDFASAQAYVDKTFPNLKGRLETAKYDMMPVGGSCKTQIYIPRTN